MSRVTAGIWWVTVAVGYLAVVPAAIGFLHRTLTSALMVERYAATIRENTAKIAEHTSSVSALQETIAGAGQLLAATDALAADAVALEGMLAAGAPGGAPNGSEARR